MWRGREQKKKTVPETLHAKKRPDRGGWKTQGKKGGTTDNNFDVDRLFKLLRGLSTFGFVSVTAH